MKITLQTNYFYNNYQAPKKAETKPLNAAFQGAQNSMPANYYPLNNFSYFTNPISFTGYTCSTDNFPLKKVEGLQCTCCGDTMLTHRSAERHAQKLANKRGEEFQDELAKVFPYLKVTEEEVANILIELAESNPNQDLRGLVRIASKDSVVNLEAKQKSIIAQIEEESKKLSPKLREEADELLKDALFEIDTSNDIIYFKKNSFMNRLRGLQANHRENEEAFATYGKMLEIADTIPNTHRDKDSFFAKYRRKTSIEIARRLLEPSLSTAEHMKARSKEGEDDTSNFIPMCKRCNTERSNIPYNEWLKKHPEMKTNLQTFIDKISVMIDEKSFQDAKLLEGYPQEVIETIERETQGQLKLIDPKIKAEEEKNEEIQEVPKTPEEKRAELEKRGFYLQEQLEILHKSKERLQNDSEFIMFCEHKKESDILKQYAKRGEEALHELSRVSRNAINIRYRISKTKDDENLKRGRFEANLALIERALEKRRQIYAQTRCEYDAQKEKVVALEYKMTFPDDMQHKIDSLREKIKLIDELERKIPALKSQIEESKEEKINAEITAINGKLRKVRERIEKREQTIDYNSNENKEALATLDVYREKLRIINKLYGQEKNVKKLVTPYIKNEGTDSLFLLRDSKELIDFKIKQLRKSYPVVRQVYDREEADRLKKQREPLFEKKNEIQEMKRTLSKSKSKLNSLNSKGGKQGMEAKIREYRKRKDELKFKIDNIDIDKQIEKTQNEANRIWTKYAESFEKPSLELNYRTQHSNSSKETSSSSSSQS